MKRTPPRHLGVLSRVAADVAIVNGAFLLAILGHYIWLTGVRGDVNGPAANLNTHLGFFTGNWWILTTLCLAVFTITGFYTHTRLYQHRYKILVATQAVSLAYLLFSFVVLMGWDVINLPRSVLLPAWLLTTLLIIGVRAFYDFARDSGDSEIERNRRIEVGEDNDASNRVLVIGGAGYIGSTLLGDLLEQQKKVRLLDMLMYGTEPIGEHLRHPNLEIIRADFRHVDQVVQATRGVGQVVHLGGIVGDPACSLNEDITVEVNLTATRTIAEIAKGSGVRRFVFASTCSVYGAGDEILDERSELRPISLYARSKLASERVLLEMLDTAFGPVVLRFGTVYGLSGRSRFDLVVNLLTAKAITEGEITVFGGDQWRPFVHVVDAGRAVLAALEAPLSVVRGEVFNVGSNEQNKTINEVAELVQNQIKSAQIVHADGGGDARDYRVNFNKIRRVLGYKPVWSLEDGIRQVMGAFENGQVLDYRAIEYSNAGFLKSSEASSSQLLTSQQEWVARMLEDTGHQRKRAVGE